MKRRARLFLTVAVATAAWSGVAWPHSPVTEPSAAWIDYSPPDVSSADRLAMEQRLAAVSYRIGVRNAELCAGANTRLLGVMSAPFDVAPGYDGRATMPLTISWVVPDGPAAGSGLRKGDQILDVDGQPLPFRPEALDRLMDRLRGHGGDVVNLGIERAGARSRVAVTPASACDYQVELSASEDVDAFAEQRQVVITEGMLASLPRDDQLAVVVGHELGHIAAGHTEGSVDPDRRMAAEAEADYLGCYFAARAGYDTSGAKDVLRRIVAARHGGSDDAAYLADIAERFHAIEAATAEINAKRTRGEALLPLPERLLHHAWN